RLGGGAPAGCCSNASAWSASNRRSSAPWTAPRMTDDTDKPRRSCAGNRLSHRVIGGDPNSSPRCGEDPPRAAAAGLRHGGFSKETVEMRVTLRRSHTEAEELVSRLLADAKVADAAD